VGLFDKFYSDFINRVSASVATHVRASLENPSTPLSAIFDTPKSSSGVTVTEENSLGVSAYFSCLKVLSETMAQMDLEVVEKVGKTTRANTSHQNYWLLHAEPNNHYNRFEWVQTMMFWAASWGNGYSLIKRDRFANAKELQIIPAYEITPKITDRGLLYYEWTKQNGDKEIIKDYDMIHLKNLGANGILGLSTAQLQRDTLGNEMAKVHQEGAFYTNGAKASGILMFPGSMGPKERKNVETSFDETHSKPANRYKTVVLEEGVKYQQLTIPQNDAQFIESRKFAQGEICGWFRIPPHMIGNLTDSNYSNMESQDRSFAKHTIVPWVVRFQQELDRKLFFDNERGKFQTQFNLDDLIKGDIKTRYEVYGSAVQFGIIKPTEAREADGWPLEGTEQIDKYFMNSTMMPVEMLGQKQEQPQPTKDKAAA
jgi:HK97 family phage portal protein